MTRDSNGAQKEKRGMFLRLERVSRDKVKPRKKIFFCLKRALFIFCKYEKKIVRLFRWPVQCRVAVVASQPGTRSTYCAVLCLARDGQGWRSCVIVSLIINRPCRGRQRRRGGQVETRPQLCTPVLKLLWVVTVEYMCWRSTSRVVQTLEPLPLTCV
jgi:hypothetical protein